MRSLLLCISLAAAFAAVATANRPAGVGTGTLAGRKPGNTMLVYVGTYTKEKSQGINVLEMDMASGKLTPKSVTGNIANPSFLAVHPNRRFLYAVNEIDSFN